MKKIFIAFLLINLTANTNPLVAPR